MLIAIAIAEEIQGSKRITLVPEPNGGPQASTLKITRSSKTMDTCGALNSRSPLLGSGTNAILFDPWIFSAMAMAMSIYRTLCVLVCIIVTSL